jgi:hypothetical protein
MRGRPSSPTQRNIKLDGVTLEQGSTSPCDSGFESVTGFCVHNTNLTNHARLRCGAAMSAESCNKPDDFSLLPAVASSSVTAGSSATFVVHKGSSGHPGPVTVKATGLRAGMTATFNPARVTPG